MQVDQAEAALTRDPRSVRTVDDSPSLVGAMILDEIKVLQAEMPQRDYLRRHVKPEYFDLPLKSVSWKISPYDYLNDMHEELVKQLGQIRQIGDDVENVDQLSRIFTDISKNVDQLVQLAQFFYGFNHLKRETLKRLYMLENELFTLTYKDAAANAVDGRQAEAFQKTRTEVKARVEELLR